MEKQLIAFFGEKIKKSHKNLKKIISQSHVSDLDKNKKSKFYYYYIGLAISASLVQYFYENQENTLCVYFAVIININGNKNIRFKTNTT